MSRSTATQRLAQSLLHTGHHGRSPFAFYLNGRATTSDETYSLFDKTVPASDDQHGKAGAAPEAIKLCDVHVANREHVLSAIEGNVKAREEMARMAPFERRAVLEHVIRKVRERQEELAGMLVLEAGKPIKDSRGEVTRLIDTFVLAAEECTRISGESGSLEISARAAGIQYFTRRFPVGPCSFIAPFNFPLNLVAHKIAPAIAAGCPFVLKPSERTPLGALLLGEVLAEVTGTLLPEGAFSILPINDVEGAASLLVEDDRMKLLSFTGSTKVGWELKKRAGRKKVVLELGGNAACIVDDTVRDGELGQIADRIIFGAFYQSGQSCISVQRLYVHNRHYDKLKNILVEKTRALKMGDPAEEETFIGPLIAESEAVRVEQWVQEAVGQGGGTVLVGGKRHGVYYEPTILENVGNDVRLSCQEVFGPVFIMEKYSSFKNAVSKVNDSEFGLQAGVFSNDIQRCFYAFENMEVGSVVINDVPSIRVDSQPYGGVKSSGMGREGVRYAIEDMTEVRAMLLKNVGAESKVD